MAWLRVVVIHFDITTGFAIQNLDGEDHAAIGNAHRGKILINIEGRKAPNAILCLKFAMSISTGFYGAHAFSLSGFVEDPVRTFIVCLSSNCFYAFVLLASTVAFCACG
jgi:hypothetical protein